jgi:hypothetical protein
MIPAELLRVRDLGFSQSNQPDLALTQRIQKVVVKTERVVFSFFFHHLLPICGDSYDISMTVAV